MPNGYTRLTIDGVRDYAHRQSHRLFIGPIPDGYEVDHACFIRICINPEHLEAVPPPENVARAAKRRRGTEFCPNGHPRAGNTGARGKCLVCLRERNHAHYVPRERKPMPPERRITHCKKAGHPLPPFDPENPRKYRGCLQCKGRTTTASDW